MLALVGLLILGVCATTAIEAYMTATANAVTYREIAAVPKRQVAVVFGAQVLPDGSPSAALTYRLDAAITLYRAGKVERLLLTGDGREDNYHEPAVMRAYALARGVPDEAIVRDDSGLRTYDSCYRATAIFGVDDAILVTQDYHLPRAIYTCERLGVRAIGFTARSFAGPAAQAALRREHPARWLAWWEVTVVRPAPHRPRAHKPDGHASAAVERLLSRQRALRLSATALIAT